MQHSRTESRSITRDLDFIYVGLPKAGSTWLFEALAEHPEARLLPSKTSKYFESDTPAPIGAYRKLLARLEPGGKVGEISHDACFHADTAQRLRDHFPDVRILVCLREPGAFAQSMLLWLGTHTNLYGSGPQEITSNAYIRGAMDFVGRLQPFYELFPAEQIKVLFFDDLVDDAPGFFREICTFIGISPDFEPSILRQIVNPARPPRVTVLTHAVFHMGRVVRALGLGGFVERVKRWSWLEALLYAPPSSAIDPAIREAAEKARRDARPTLEALERLIGRPVPPAWRD